MNHNGHCRCHIPNLTDLKIKFSVGLVAEKFYYSLPFSVRYAIDAMSAEGFAPGDAVLLNDPYRGGSHLPDVTIVNYSSHPLKISRIDPVNDLSGGNPLVELIPNANAETGFEDTATLEFDPTSGAIVELDLGDLGRVAGDRLVGLGAYAVVVRGS